MSNNPVYNPYDHQPPPVSGQQGQQATHGNSYASRSAQAFLNSASSVPPPVDQYQQSLPPQLPQVPQPHSQSFQQPQYYTLAPPVTQQPPADPSYNSQYGRMPSPYHNPNSVRPDNRTKQSQQNSLETSIRRMQEATHIMRGSMDADDLATTLDRAVAMLGELGDPKHHHHHHHGHGHHNHSSHNHSSSSSTAVISPKDYYEIHMLAMEELPNIEEFFLSLSSGPNPQYSMKDLYEITQYTSRAVPRLYLQICAGSALIRSGEDDVTNVLNDLIQAVKCVQCPIRGLFLRDYLLKAVRDKLPDEAEISQKPDVQQHLEGEQLSSNNLTTLMGNNLRIGRKNNCETGGFLQGGEVTQTSNFDPNTVGRPRSDSFDNPAGGHVKDSYQFVLANFIEMNKLWVRIQHLPGDAKNKETKRRRERERNELRMMVGTNLVRLSELEGVTSAIYGTVILPRILDQIVACRDPLAQAYLMDCIIQVFPDEFHIQTLEVVLGVCPKLREKVNIRTILQSIMDRLSNYYSDELLLNDEEDTEGVKTSVMLDSFEMFDECIRSVLEGRGAKINAREVVRLESSLLDFSLKCYPGRMDHINRCLGVCAACLRGEGTSNASITAGTRTPAPIPIDEVAIKELEILLSLPLETMGLNVLDLDQYSELLKFLPLDHRKRVALELLNVLYQSGEKMTELSEIEQLFTIISPLIWSDGTTMTGPNSSDGKESVSKLIHLLHNEDTDIQFEILNFVKKYLFSSGGGIQACSYTASPLFYSSMKLLGRVQNLEFPVSEEAKIEVEEIEVEVSEKEDKEIEINDEANEAEKKEITETNIETDDLVDGDKEENVQIIKEALGEEETCEKPDTSSESGKDIVAESDFCGEGTNDGENNLEEDGNQTIEEDCHETGDGDAKADIKVDDETISCFKNDKEINASDPEENQITEEVGQLEMDPDEQIKKGKDGVEEVNNENVTSTSDVVAKNTQHYQNSELFPFDDTSAAKSMFTKATNCRKIFLFVQKLLSFVEMTSAELCFNLRLQAASAANNCAIVSTNFGNKGVFATIAYEFMSEAFLTYEGEITESSAQGVAMMKIIGVLLACDSFQKSDYETLITKATQNSARLLKKTDQCSMVLMCSHLFYKDEKIYQNPQRVLECLQRALKLADMCTTANPTNLSLFIDILDKYVYYFENGNPFITDKFVSGLIALINEHINSIGVSNNVIGEAKDHFTQILRYIESKKSDDTLGEKFSMIICTSPGF